MGRCLTAVAGLGYCPVAAALGRVALLHTVCMASLDDVGLGRHHQRQDASLTARSTSQCALRPAGGGGTASVLKRGVPACQSRPTSQLHCTLYWERCQRHRRPAKGGAPSCLCVLAFWGSGRRPARSDNTWRRWAVVRAARDLRVSLLTNLPEHPHRRPAADPLSLPHHAPLLPQMQALSK